MTTLKHLLTSLDNAGDAVEPYDFLNTFFGEFPQFAEKGQHGGFQQQDADECFQNLLTVLETTLTSKKNKGGNVIEDLFRFNIVFELSNREDETEAKTQTYEVFRKLGCLIDNQANPVNTLAEGIEAGLGEEIEKFSEVNNRNCFYKKQGKIATLPKYLIVQKLRFIWKGADDGSMTEARKAKI